MMSDRTDGSREAVNSAAPDSVTCPQCKVTVEKDKVDLPGRCHRDCPLNNRATAALPLRGEFTQIEMKAAKPVAFDPILRAHAAMVGELAKLSVPSLHVNPTPEEFEAVGDYIASCARIFDIWHKAMGDEVDSASTARINLNLFSDIFFDAIDGWGLSEISKAASVLREEIDEIEDEATERAVRHGRTMRSLIDVLRAERGI